MPVLWVRRSRTRAFSPLLDAVVDYLPSPLDIPGVQGINPDTEADSRKTADDAPVLRPAFKIMNDPFVGSLTFLRVYSGTLTKGTYLNSVKDKKEKIGRMLLMHANSRERRHRLCGRHRRAGRPEGNDDGDTLCAEKQPIILERMEFPEPVIELSVEPKTKADQERWASRSTSGRRRSSFRVSTDHESARPSSRGMGELHLEILVDRMKREFKVEANVGAAGGLSRISRRRSTSTTPKKQTGGSGQFGRKVSWSRAAAVPGSFFDEIVGGNMPKNISPGVEKGLKPRNRR